MSDTTNSGADPWGLPETEEAPPPEPDAAKAGAPSREAPEETAPPIPDDLPNTETEAPEQPTPATPPVAPVEEAAPSASTRGPLSQVLAASGLFGGTPVPPRNHEPEPVTAPVAEPDVPQEQPAPIESPVGQPLAEEAETEEAVAPDSAAPEMLPLEPETTEPLTDVPAPDTEDLSPPEAPAGEQPPGLSMPSGGSPIGFGATDDDLPPEPPPWMTGDVPSTRPERPQGVADEAGAVIDEAAAAFAASPDSTAESSEQPDVDTDIESLVAEIADSALGTDGGDFAINPDDTPAVFRELEDLPASADQVHGPTDELVEPATVAFEDTAGAEAAPEEDGTERFGAEWAVIDPNEPPPDAPVFGVTFGGQPTEEAPAEDIAPPVIEEVPVVEEPAGMPAEETLSEPPLIESTVVEETSVDEAPAEEAPTEDAPVVEEVPVELTTEPEETPASPEEREDGAAVPADLTEDETQAVTSQPEESAIDGIAAWPTPEPVVEEPAESIVPADEPLVETTPESRIEVEDEEPAPVEWGSRWQESAQGWVEDDLGRSTWRPIVTTSPLLSEWKIDTYLGVVTADVILGSGPIETEMATGRSAAMRAIINDAMERGAHAVVGVATTVAPVGSAAVLTATGTAVTLKAPD